MSHLHPDDPELIEKLKALRPEDIKGALRQVLKWEATTVRHTVVEWLVTAARHHANPDDVQIAILFGASTERLRWKVHIVPSRPGRTPYRLALTTLEHAKGQKKGGKAEKRRKWAELLAGHLVGQDKHSALAALDEGIEIEEARLGDDEYDLRFSIEGDNIACDNINTQANVGKMTVRNFFERYFRSK